MLTTVLILLCAGAVLAELARPGRHSPRAITPPARAHNPGASVAGSGQGKGGATVTSYQLSQAYNFQSVLWAVAGAIHQTPTALTRWSVWVSGLIALGAADLALLLSGLLTVLAWCVGIAAIVLGLGWLLPTPVVLLTLLGIAA